MRLFHILPVLGLFFGARASDLDPRSPGKVHPHPHVLDVHNTADVCASLNNTQLMVPNQQRKLTTVGTIGASTFRFKSSRLAFPVAERSTVACLCQSGIPMFLQTNPVAMKAVTIAGAQEVTKILTQLVRR